MRINGTTKSLVANHLAESVAGATTIRAFEEEDRFFSKNLELIDRNASPFFHNFAASEWLIQRLETMGAVVLSTSALVMALLPPGTFSSGEFLVILLCEVVNHNRLFRTTHALMPCFYSQFTVLAFSSYKTTHMRRIC